MMGVPNDGETFTLNGHTFTFRAQPTRPDEVLIGGSENECFANWHEAVRRLFPEVPPLKESQ